MWRYLFIVCFDWKIGVFQQTVVRVYYILKAVHKNNPRTHSLQQNEKAVLTTAAYFRVSTPVRLERQ